MENIVNADTSSQQSFDVDMNALNEPQMEGNSNDSQNPDVHTNTDNTTQIEIDERYKELPIEEARLRTLQSQRDSIRAEHMKLVKAMEEKEKITNFFDQMLEDENLLVAFINQVKPDLVKPRDLGAQLKEQLYKEFGEDFKPTLSRDEAERDDPFGKDAQYYARVDVLRKQLIEGSNATQPLSVKEYLAQKRAKEEAEAKKYESEREAVKAKYKMSDEEVKAVSDWAMKLDFDQIVQVHRFLRRTTKIPNITNVTGAAPGIKSDRQKFLDEIF